MTMLITDIILILTIIVLILVITRQAFKIRQTDRFTDYMFNVIEDDWKERSAGNNQPFVDIPESYNRFEVLHPWEDSKFSECVVRRNKQ